MKQHQKWFAAALAVAGSLVIVSSAPAQTVIATLSNFQNFNLDATYGNWNDPGWTTFGGGAGIMAPVITSGSTPGSYEVEAGGYGSGAFWSSGFPVNATGANAFRFTFTLNQPADGPAWGAGVYWMNPMADIVDGTHLVNMVADASSLPNGSVYLNYGNYGLGTYTLWGSLQDLDVTDIIAFNLEFDPAGNAPGDIYDITFDSLELINIPEPTTLALLGVGAVGLLIARRRVS